MTDFIEPGQLRVNRYLGLALRNARENTNLSQDDAAELLGWSRTTLTRLENGQRRIDADELAALAQRYGVSPVEVLSLALAGAGFRQTPNA